MGDQHADSPVASRINALDRSSIRVMFELANETDEQLARLEVGEPDMTTPEHIIQAAAEAARDGGTHYTSNAGMMPLREAVADAMERDVGLTATPEEVVVTNGAMEALYLSLLSVVDSGEEVVIPTPCWPNYAAQVRLAGGELTEVPLDPDAGFALDPDRVVDAISDQTAAVVLNSPCNPTGQVFDTDAVAAIADEAAAHDAYVVADEVYDGFVYDRSFTGIGASVDHPDRVITVNACSKKYAMTGWRLGWLVAPPAVADAAAKLHQATTSCASSVSQHAALAALTGDQQPAREIGDLFETRRDYVVDRLADIPGVSAPRPGGSFYAFVDVSGFAGTSVEIAKRLLREHGVVTAPGSGFGTGGEGFLRLSFATDLEELERGLGGLAAMAAAELDD